MDKRKHLGYWERKCMKEIRRGKIKKLEAGSVNGAWLEGPTRGAPGM